MFFLKLNSIWIILLDIWITQITGASMKWHVPSGDFVDGHDVILSCDRSSCKHYTRKWLGGNEYLRLLCTNENSVFPNKYVYKENDNDTFSLMIKNATYEDYISRYSCSCGFHHYTSTMEEKNVTFVYIPKYDEVKYKFEIQNEKLYVRVNISRVSPIPECNLHIKSVPVKILEVRTEKEKVNGTYTNLQLKTEFDIEDYRGPQNVTVKCIIFDQFIYEVNHLVIFQPNADKNSNIWQWVVLSIGLIAAIVIVLLARRRLARYIGYIRTLQKE